MEGDRQLGNIVLVCRMQYIVEGRKDVVIALSSDGIENTIPIVKVYVHNEGNRRREKSTCKSIVVH